MINDNSKNNDSSRKQNFKKTPTKSKILKNSSNSSSLLRNIKKKITHKINSKEKIEDKKIFNYVI